MDAEGPPHMNLWGRHVGSGRLGFRDGEGVVLMEPQLPLRQAGMFPAESTPGASEGPAGQTCEWTV